MEKGVRVGSWGGRGEGLRVAGRGTLPPPLPCEVWQEVGQLGQQGKEARGPWAAWPATRELLQTSRSHLARGDF